MTIVGTSAATGIGRQRYRGRTRSLRSRGVGWLRIITGQCPDMMQPSCYSPPISCGKRRARDGAICGSIRLADIAPTIAVLLIQEGPKDISFPRWRAEINTRGVGRHSMVGPSPRRRVGRRSNHRRSRRYEVCGRTNLRPGCQSLPIGRASSSAARPA